MVRNPSKYQWSSYSAFIGKLKTPPFLETDWLLSNFGKSKKEANRNYKDFVDGVDGMDIKTIENPHKQVSEGFILGDLDFVNWVKDTFLSSRQDEKEIPKLKKLKPKVQLETIVKAVCEEFDCTEEQIITKGRKKNKALEMAIHIARDLSGMSCKDLGLYFGEVCGVLITNMYKRVTKEAAKNRRLKRRIEKVKKRIFKGDPLLCVFCWFSVLQWKTIE